MWNIKLKVTNEQEKETNSETQHDGTREKVGKVGVGKVKGVNIW